MGIVEQYLLQLNTAKKRLRRATALITVLSILVVSAVSWNLRLTGVTLANDASCGYVEHQHTDDCPVERVLICGYPEVPDADAPTVPETEVPSEPVTTPIEEKGSEPAGVEETEPPSEEPADEESPQQTEPPTEEPTEEETPQQTQPPAEEPADEELPQQTEPPTEKPADVEPPAEVEPPQQTEQPLEPPTEAAQLAMQQDNSPRIVMLSMVTFIEPLPVPLSDVPEEEHVHTDACYQTKYLCNLEEHLHKLSCYSDSTADLESADVWEATLPQLTKQWASNLVSVAKSQLGCGESQRNFLVGADETTRNGITRYGQWYGNPYGDWSSMFLMFCMHYAGIPDYAIPRSPGVYNMMRLAQDAALVLQPDDSVGEPGNILFLDTDGNNKADHSLIVTGASAEKLTAIGGDWEDSVCEVTLRKNDSRILGYINVAKVQEPEETVPEETVPEETVPEATEPEATEPEATEPEATEPGETVPEETTAEDAAQETEPDPDMPQIELEVSFPDETQTMCLVARTTNIDESMFTWQWQVSEDGNDPWTDIEGANGLSYELEATEENLLRYYRLQGRKIEQTRMMFALSRAATITDEESGTITSGAISPMSIGKNNNNYTIEVYAIPVDAAGVRIADRAVTPLSSITVNRDVTNNNKFNVSTRFNTSLGLYQSAYFGTETSVEVDNVKSVWRNYSYSNRTYCLAYDTTTDQQNTSWKSSADASISLYLRYIPFVTVTFESEDYAPVTENLLYGGVPTLTEPGTWLREGYTLGGWTIDPDEQTVYTYEELLKRPVTADVTYRARWWMFVNVSYDLGVYADSLYPIEPDAVNYGTQLDQYPTPAWRDNTVLMAFDGWYLDETLTQPVPPDYEFYQDTTLYAKWTSKDDGYYVYFMDFDRQEETPLVLMTYGVTEGRTASPYIPGNAPEGTRWDGVWYLDEACTQPYDFAVPVSQMTDHLTGANSHDLYLYPGTQAVCRAIFVTYGTKIDPVTVIVGETINLDEHIPERYGYEFAGWVLKDGTPVSGQQVLNETTTYYALWEAGYVPFEAIARIENANDTGMTQADILGTWYAKAGSEIRVNSTYTGTGDSRTGTHTVVCVLDGVEYPVYQDAALSKPATLADVYATYYVYNNAGTDWTDEVNWDDVYTGGELPYSTRPVSSSGDTIINFDYMRVRNDIVFIIPNSSTEGGFIDIYKLQQNGLISGSVVYTDVKPTAEGSNVSASGVSATNVSWSYSAATTSNGNNLYTLHNMKYGQRIYEVYPVGGSWLTARNAAYHQYVLESNELFSSRRQDLTSDFFSGSGRALSAYTLTAQFVNQEYIALMYAVECLPGETADFTINGIGYKVDTELCEVVKHTGGFGIKDLDGCEPGINSNGTYVQSNQTHNKYYKPTYSYNERNYSDDMRSATVGGTSVYTLFAQTYWPYYAKFNGVESVNTFAKAYIFYYNRLHMDIQFNFGYDSDGDGTNETQTYSDLAYGENIEQYQFGAPDFEKHGLLEREGYEFAGWLDSNGYVLEAEDWASMVATGDSEHSSMIFVAKWEKISNNIVEYYEDISAEEPFEKHYFDDGALLEYPTMSAYPQGWVWQENGEGAYERFDWDVPMYGEYGVREVREIDGEELTVNVLRIYGTWDETHTRVVYDPNAAQGGIPGTTPVDSNEYTIWQSEVSVMSPGNTANTDPDAIFVGWQLDRDGIVYQPGDHVAVRWPRTMIFVAQWAKPEEVVHLRYDPNGGTPEGQYPNSNGFAYRRGATAVIWDNTAADGAVWYHRIGYTFTGWNTQPDGSGTAYRPGGTIVLTEPMTTLYAQWQRDTHKFILHKTDRISGRALKGAVFDLYKYQNGDFLWIESQTSGGDGRITFSTIETGTLYKLVETRPPDGYAIITREFCFRLTPGMNSVHLEFCDSQGTVIDSPSGVSGEYLSGNRHLMLTVQNIAGYELPATGGIGTPLYILCGVILMLAPFVYGFRLRRRYGRGADG